MDSRNDQGPGVLSPILELQGNTGIREPALFTRGKDYIGSPRRLENTFIVALSGKMGAGKDWLATRIMCELLQLQIDMDPFLFRLFREQFGGAVKQVAGQIYNENSFWDEMYELKKAEPREALNGLSIREAMILIGEGMKEILGQAVWVNALEKSIAEIHTPDHPLILVIPDLRFQVEYDWIRQHPFTHIHIHNDPNPSPLFTPDHVFENSRNETEQERLGILLRAIKTQCSEFLSSYLSS